MKYIKHLGKNIGVINNNNAFVTYREEKHYFRMFQGFGLSYRVLDILKSENINNICICYNDKTGINLLRTTLKTWLEKSNIYKDKSQDYQRILGIKYFYKDKCD